MNTNQINIAVIGVGYLGEFHAEKCAALPNINLVAVCDNNPVRAQYIANKHNCQAFTDYKALLATTQLDAVSIVVPTTLHYAVAKDCLQQGLHVLIEKPITQTVAQAEELITLAKRKQKLLQVGHLERFNPVLLALANQMHQPRFIESIRLAPFQLRGSDVNVVLDLMIHDIDIVQWLIKSPIVRIDANGTQVLSQHIDIANARLTFENGCVANVTASRVNLNKKRKLRIFQPKGYLSIDLQNKKLAHHYKSDTSALDNPTLTSDEQVFEPGDALLAEIQAFAHAIQSNTAVPVSGEDGKNALEIAIQITNIILNQELTPQTA